MGRKPLPPLSPSDRPKSLRELAGTMGIPYERARRLRQDGLSTEKDGTYDLRKAKRFMEERAARGQDISPTSSVAFTAKEDKIRAEARLKQLELARELAKVVDKDTVITEWRRRIVQIRNRFMGLGPELAPRLVGKGVHEIQAIITEAVAERLRILGHEKYAVNN